MKIRTIKSMLMALCIALACVALPVSAASNDAAVRKLEKKMAAAQPTTNLSIAMRQLWEEHIVYTRNFIISGLAGLEDAGPIAERLLRNQDDIGNAIKPYYGDEAGNKLTALLREHILIAADIVKAAKAGDNAGVGAGQKAWLANADDIAAFLSSANPNWPKPVLTEMLHKHLDLTTKEVVSRLQKDWKGDIDAYDQGHVHMLMFSDMLTSGIIKQFPKKFAK